MDAAMSSNQECKESVYNKITTEFKTDIVKETLKLYFTDTKTKISEEAVELIREVMKAMSVEAAIRSAKQATTENKSIVTVNHVENMLLQMLLDFP